MSEPTSQCQEPHSQRKMPPISTTATTTTTTTAPWTPAEDATMRNAVAFLAQKDSESALIYALVHDPEFRLATALTSNAHRAVDVSVVRALLHIFDAYEDQLRRFLALLMLREMVDTLNWNELFRANSATTALVREYTCDLGQEFLQSAFQDILAEIWECTESYEVNPRLLGPEDDLQANQKRLETLATRLLERVFDAAPLFPYQIAKIYRVMELEMTRLIERDRKSNLSLPRLSAISEDASLAAMGAGQDDRRSVSSLPRLSAISEDLFSGDDQFNVRGSLSSGGSGSGSGSSSGNGSTGAAGISAAKEEFYVHLGGFLFLRFLCPALLMPHKMGLTPQGQPPSKHLQRTLVLVAKLFQSLANNVDYGQREEYMAPFNAFLTQNRATLFQFYDQICQQSQNDNRRESLITRSNLAPRISQLWVVPSTSSNISANRGSLASASSSVSANAPSTAYGLLGNQPLMASVEDALTVLQQWMLTNLEQLVKEVSTNGKSKRKNSSGVSSGSGSGSGGSLSPVAKKKKAKSPKHKLKSSKTLSPVPSRGGTTEEDDETEEQPEKQETTTESGTSNAPPENVSPEELERMLGHTTHRDIQLMKIYYSNLSQTGLSRLLQINNTTDDMATATTREWSLYRSRHGVDVFRREDPSHPSRSCVLNLSRSRSASGDSSDRFVEMKAHVEIQATPRQVFKYLRSLEKMTEWDDRVSRKVEPLDDSKVVLYSSQPKLSLWPTWLVKPRDSCDLHSFVDSSKTGRADTYAVLMESVPRPDVPTIKGTVRMSFATGGFLVEPSDSRGGDESDGDSVLGQTTKLTCVVKADFKGSLPRYLAESICFRQVLSVAAIKLRIESAMHHGQSTWV